MSPLQRIIKIIATIFAIFLAISIIGAIIGGIFFAMNINTKPNTSITSNSGLDIGDDEFHYNDDKHGIHINVGDEEDESDGNNTMSNYETYDFTQSYTNVESLDIEATINRVILSEGDEFRVNMKNVSTNCKVSEKSGVLSIKDSSHYGDSFLSWIGDLLDGKGLSSLKGGTITITYPKGFIANKCDIEAGTGSVQISNLQTTTLNIEAGTGSISGNDIVAGYMDLECGTGSVNLDTSSFSGSEIEAGTGSITINGKMTGQNTIECGVGSVYLGLEDSQDSYKLEVEKGLGHITIDGSSYSSVSTISPNAANSLSIEGGIGSVTIDFAKQF
ncbi:MAG: DUF4097 family beta strand repeat-containing protein [Velocimicrobium sp.]